MSAQFMLTRFSPTGVPDPGFGDGAAVYSDLSRGIILRDATLHEIALQADGRIVAAGSVFNFWDPSPARSGALAVVRYLPDGRLDPGFGANGLVVTPPPSSTRAGTSFTGGGGAAAVAVDGAGRVVAGGTAFGFGTGDMAVARYTPTGALDPNFGRAGWAKLEGPGEVDGITAVAVLPDGRPLFAGSTDWERVLVVGRLGGGRLGTTVTAWGWNAMGQLGDGSTTSRPAPVVVQVPGSVATPAVGSLHSLSLQGDGTARAWGSNEYGQVGDGTTIERRSPVAVRGLANVAAVAAGTYHSLAVSGGRVYAWGWNGVGALGDGTMVDRRSPVVVPGLTDVVEVSAGIYHSMARRSDGTVWAWGWNGLGQLGDGTTTSRSRPVRVTGVFRATAISAGALHSLAAAAAGEASGASDVWAWGHNGTGQVTRNFEQIVATPTRVGGYRPSAISAGAYHNVTLLDDGTVYAWGWNGVGQLGNGTTGDIDFVANPALDATAVSAGLAHTLVADRRGRVSGWGWNALGQLGDGTTTDRLRPTLGLATGAPSAGWYHSLSSSGP